MGYAIIPACIVGLVNLLIFSKLGHLQKKYQREAQKKKSIRINLISEFLSNIKTSKLYSWT
jgi:hypothetical protein